MNGTQNQLFLSGAASTTGGAAKSNFLAVARVQQEKKICFLQLADYICVL
jgi:hypothetical protein